MICDRRETEKKNHDRMISLLSFSLSPFFLDVRHVFCESLEIERRSAYIYVSKPIAHILTIITEVNSTHTVVSNTSIDHLSDDVSTPLVHTHIRGTQIDRHL